MGFKYINIAIALATVVSVKTSAQELSKEITIDKDIVPELKESNRLNVTPQIPPLNVKTTKLNYNDKAKTAVVPPAITTLEPAENVDTIALSKYRGYAMVGYFPVYNLDLSAGYRILDKKDMKLNAWVQYNGKSYDAVVRNGSELTFNDHELTLNADYAQLIDAKTVLSVAAQYTFNSFSCPWIDDYTQSVNRFSVDGRWQSAFEGLNYNVGVGYRYFGYGKDAVYDKLQYQNVGSAFDAVKEHSGYLNAGASLATDDNSQVALDFGMAIIHDNHLTIPAWTLSQSGVLEGYRNNPTYNHSILTLTPHYDTKIENVSAKIGVQLDYQIDIDNEFNISPDVYVDWAPSSIISAYAHVTGGVHQNTMSSIFDVSHYFAPSMAYQNSKLPYIIDAGINVGPFKNATLELFGGYAKANDWYMPAIINGENVMNEVDLGGWHFGVAASYNYKDMAKVRASYESVPQSYDNGYYLWRDRAKYVVKASATVTPIAPLDVTLDYEYRGNRCTYSQSVVNVDNIVALPVYDRVSLGHVSNLSLGGLYRFNDQLNFFARLENLLNHKYDMLYDIPSQGFTGLVGASYKF